MRVKLAIMTGWMTRTALCFALLAGVASGAHSDGVDRVGLLSTVAKAHETETLRARIDIESLLAVKEQTCPELVETLNNTDWQLDGFAAQIKGLGAAVSILAHDCPTDPPDVPIRNLLEYHEAQEADDLSFLLGAAYEYGLRVEPDPDEARYWYRRFAFSAVGISKGELDFVRQQIAALHHRATTLSSDALDDKSTSGLFENAIAAVRKLMESPAVDIVAVSKHLHHGTGGFHQSTSSAKTLLYLTAKRGAPEAQYALAEAALEREFYILPMMPRSIQLLRVQGYLTDAAKQQFLPAIKELAAFCEKYREKLGPAFAMALYLYAKSEGAQDVDQHLRRLRQYSDNHFDRWVERTTREISNGQFPVCR